VYIIPSPLVTAISFNGATDSRYDLGLRIRWKLADHPFYEMLVVKGATALRRRWFENYRFSEDLDFTLTRRITFEKIMAELNEIFALAKAVSGPRIAFDREDRHNHQNSYTFYS
jgi:predicted nucleotidyltransferase component of viral defense system